ncbi:MAG TPA: sulfite exporter TauE/SafE family protein [Patescibacteria group bacterium]|nr:sulfite exporter TauE/SafE family protein [Patescibacteria group bacterium]
MFPLIANLFVTGLLLGCGPCAASCGPILVSYVAGTRKNVTGALAFYAQFCAGRMAVYAGLSIAVFFAGSFVFEGACGSIARYAAIAGGAFIAVIGVLMALGKDLAWPVCRMFEAHFLQKGYPSALLLGLVLGISPCAPLFAVLSYVGLVSKTWAQAFCYGLAFGAGTCVSVLIVLVALAGCIPAWLRRGPAIYVRLLRTSCGLVIAVLGIQVIMKAYR